MSDQAELFREPRRRCCNRLSFTGCAKKAGRVFCHCNLNLRHSGPHICEHCGEPFRAYQGQAAYARNTDPITSHLAPMEANVPKLELEALRGLAILGRSTRNDVGEYWVRVKRLSPRAVDSYSPRFKPLEDKGLIRKTGERRDRSEVIEITPAGKDLLNRLGIPVV